MAGVPLTGKIVPLNDGAFPVFEDINGQGGLRAVADIAARDAIPDNSRKVGMVVVTQDDGVQYQLVGGIDNADYQIVRGQVVVSVARINAGNGGGTKLVDIPTTTLISGSLATVFSVGALFSLEKAPDANLLALVDGITVVASIATAGSVWVRLDTVADPRFGATPPLFIDPALGSDDNTGASSGAGALKTADEWCRRMRGQVLRSPWTVACAAGDIGNVALDQISNITAGVGYVTMTGVSSKSVAVGTISSVTAENSATRQEFSFLDSSGVGPTITDGDRLEIVASATPANVGAVGYVKGFDAGGVTNPYTTVWMTTNGAPFFPSVGDTYVVSSPATIIRSVLVNWVDESISPQVGGMFFSNIRLQASRIPGYTLFSNFFEGNPNFGNAFFNCVFDDLVATNFYNCLVRMYGCEFKAPVTCSLNTTVNFHGCTFRAGLTITTATTVTTSGGTCYFDTLPAADAATAVNIASTGGFVCSSQICISRQKSTATGMVLVQGQSGFWYPVFDAWSPALGSRNAAAYGLQIYSGGSVSLNAFANISLLGSIANVALQSQLVLQNTLLENNKSGIYDTTIGSGSIMRLRDLYAPTGGFVPSTSPPAGHTDRWGFSGLGQFARGAGGALTTVAAGGTAAAGHAALTSLLSEGGPINTVNTATSSICTVNTAASGIATTTGLNNCGFYVEATFVGYDSANSAVVTMKVARAFKRIAGTLTALGGGVTVLCAPIGDAALLGAVPLLVASGTNIVANVIGVASTTIAWNVKLDIKTSDFVG